MSASEIQQTRTRNYFIDAAKEILRGEGLKVASARNISDRAGYSYATLYNYFDDLTSLIFECVKDFQKEIEEFVVSASNMETSGEAKIRAGLTAWVNYFVQYPGIFELYFLEKINEAGFKRDIADTIYNSINPACRDGLAQMIDEQKLTPEQAEKKLDSIRYRITGLLLYYGNRKTPSDYSGLIEKLNIQIEQILNS